MATVTLIPLSYSASPAFGGLPITSSLYIPTGDSDAGVCLQAAGDGKTLVGGGPGHNANAYFYLYFADPGTISLPATATINSVKLYIVSAATDMYLQGGGTGISYWYGGSTPIVTTDFSSRLSVRF